MTDARDLPVPPGRPAFPAQPDVPATAPAAWDEAMTVVWLFRAWEAMQRKLRDPFLPEDMADALAEHAERMVLAMAHTRAAEGLDVALKFEVYVRESVAGPSPACDALLDSALRGRAELMPSLASGLAADALAAGGLAGHGAPPQEPRRDRSLDHRSEGARPAHP